MDFGMRTNENGCFCIICNELVDENMNFCPKCANPLNLNAFNLQQEKFRASNLQLLTVIAQNTKDEKTLQTIQKLIKKL